MPSIPQRLDELELRLTEQQARRLALLVALLGWLNDDDSNDGFLALRVHLEERIADEGP